MYVLGTPASSPPAQPPPRRAATSEVIFARAAADTPRTESVPTSRAGLVRGRATITIAAPIDKVRQVVLDFAHYPDFMPHYRKCSVVGPDGDGVRKVTMEVEALQGLVIMWARLDILKPVVANGVETYDSRFLEGNVNDLKAIWRLKKLDEGSTELSLEVFLYPKFPLPDSVINQQNLDGATAGVLAVKRRVLGG
jgi:ribosome-associated toxin RatA of RatAB toxin-antitoxin module